MDELDEALARFGGPVTYGELPQSVEKTLEEYKQLSGINPIFVPGVGPLKTSPPSRFASFHFVDNWSCNALVTLSRDGPLFLCNAGLPFIIEDYLSRLLSYKSVLRDFDSDKEDESLLGKPFSLVFDYQRLGTGGYKDIMPPEFSGPLYGSLLAKDGESLASKTTRFTEGWRTHLPIRPVSQMRRGLVSYMTNIINAFLFGHEAGHVDRGHLEFLRRRTGTFHLAEFNMWSFGSYKKIDTIFYHSMEYQADLMGFRRAFDFLSIHVPKNRFWEFAFVNQMDKQEKMRIWIFAITALFCLLDWEDIKSQKLFARIFSKESKHPSGSSRLCNLINSFSNNVSMSEGTNFDVKRFRRDSGKDMLDVASVLGISEQFLKSMEPKISFAEINSYTASINDELCDCVDAIQNMYFIRGKRAGDLDIAKVAENPFKLPGQYMHVFDENGNVTHKIYCDTGLVEHFNENGELIGTSYTDESVPIPTIEIYRPPKKSE